MNTPDKDERIVNALTTILEKSNLSEVLLHANIQHGDTRFDNTTPGISIKVAHTSQPSSVYNPAQMVYVSKRLQQIAMQINEYLEVGNAVKVTDDYGFDELKHLPSKARKPKNMLVVDKLVLSQTENLKSLEKLANNFVLNDAGIHYETALEHKASGRQI